MGFHVGQRVKYIGPDKVALAATFGLLVPVPDGEYTVRRTGVHNGNAAIHLNEIRNVPLTGHCDELWMEEMFFRPLIERKTDISVFTEILKRESAPIKKPVKANCGND